MTTATHNKITRFVQFAQLERNEPREVLAAVLGVSVSSVSKRLLGHVRWSVDDLDLLADHYGVTVAQLVEPPSLVGPPPLRPVIAHRGGRTSSGSVNPRERRVGAALYRLAA